MIETPKQSESIASEYGSDIEIQSANAMSDYGSDIDLADIDEDSLLDDMLTTLKDAAPTFKSAFLPSIEFEVGELEDEEHNVDGAVQTQRCEGLRVAKKSQRSTRITDESHVTQNVWAQHKTRDAKDIKASQHARSGPFGKSDLTPQHAQIPAKPIQDAFPVMSKKDLRPPIERFRTKPKKPLSVTDLVSPAWCELQYLYTLSNFGRKPRTQAMRDGSKIHQQLEDEVHVTVPVQVQSNEDKFGLRLWNVISGLRCLRETGLTRELEIWGIVEGQVVNGIIDQLSYTRPGSEDVVDRVLEANTDGANATSCSQLHAHKISAQPNVESGQLSDIGAQDTELQIYITDVKTRSVSSLPRGAALRPTWMQLMLYRRILESMSHNSVDAEAIFARYNLRPLEPFTQAFLCEMGDIGPENEAANFPNLLSLWALLITEMQDILPTAQLSTILQAEFRYNKTGEIIGSKAIIYDSGIIEQYIADEMAWWKGDREAKGVEVDEAFKCRICDFAEGCTWRSTKIEEATEKSRLRKQAKKKSTV